MKKVLQVLLKYQKTKEHKLILCMITVIVTSLTLFCALNALPLLEESIKQDLRQTTVGKADYIVTQKDNQLYEIPELKQGKVLDILALDGSITNEKNTRISVWGLEYEKYLEVFGDTYMEKGNVSFPKSLKRNQVLITPDLSEKLGISDGAEAELEIYGKKIKVNAVIAPEDNYFVRANEDLVIVNKEILYDALEIEENLVSLCYVYGIFGGLNIEEIFMKENNSLYVTEAIDPEYISVNMSTYYGIDILIFVFILLIAGDILKSTGLIYVTERSKFIGTLRSNGAEKRQIIRLFTKIGFRVAFIGSFIGMLTGMGLILFFAKFGVGLEHPLQGINITFLCIAVVVSGLVTLLLTGISFQKPVKRLLIKSDRALILEDVSAQTQHEKNSKYSMWYVVILFVLIVMPLFQFDWGMAIITIYSAVLVYILIKSVKVIFIAITTAVQKKTGKGLLLIAAKNVGTNTYLRKTLTLTTTISLFITIIGILIFSVLDAMTSFYRDYKADAYVRIQDGEEFLEEELDGIYELSDIDDTYLYYSGRVTIEASGEERNVKAIGLDDPVAYDKNFMNLNLAWAEGFDSTSFKNGRNTIMSEILCNRFGVKPGDVVTLDDGKIKEKYYVAAVTTSLQELGDAIYISRYDTDFCDGCEFNGIYLKGKEAASIEKQMEQIFYERKYTFKDVSDMKKNDMTNGMQIIIFFVSFAILVGLTSITGIYSNYKLSYMMRRKEFAILMSSGYSKKHIFKILCLEIIMISMMGYGVGVILMWLIKKPLENLMKLVDMPIELNMSIEIFYALFMVVTVMMLINISLAKKSSRLSGDSFVEVLKK